MAATSAHSATSAATANRIMRRDSAGRVQVAAPSAAADVARKAEVDAVSSALNTHKSSSDHDGRYFTETEANARFAPMAHDHVGGDGATLSHQAMANRTRSFLVPAQPGEFGPNPGEFGAAPGGWAGVKLPDGIASQAVDMLYQRIFAPTCRPHRVTCREQPVLLCAYGGHTTVRMVKQSDCIRTARIGSPSVARHSS